MNAQPRVLDFRPGQRGEVFLDQANNQGINLGVMNLIYRVLENLADDPAKTPADDQDPSRRGDEQ